MGVAKFINKAGTTVFGVGTLAIEVFHRGRQLIGRRNQGFAVTMWANDSHGVIP